MYSMYSDLMLCFSSYWLNSSLWAWLQLRPTGQILIIPFLRRVYPSHKSFLLNLVFSYKTWSLLNRCYKHCQTSCSTVLLKNIQEVYSNLGIELLKAIIVNKNIDRLLTYVMTWKDWPKLYEGASFAGQLQLCHVAQAVVKKPLYVVLW